MARVNGKKPPVFVNSRPDDKRAKLPGHRQVSVGFILGCGAPLHATSTTGDSLRESCGSQVEGYMILCPACSQTHASFDLQYSVRVRPVSKGAI